MSTEFTFTHDTFLTIEGKQLYAAAVPHAEKTFTPERFRAVNEQEFSEILQAAKPTIDAHMEEFRAMMQQQNPEWSVGYPTISVLHLASDGFRRKILSQKGLDYGGLRASPTYITEITVPYWEAVSKARFFPEIRVFGKSGYWLSAAHESEQDTHPDTKLPD